MKVNTFRIVQSADLLQVGVSMQIRGFSNTINDSSLLYPTQSENGLYNAGTQFPVYKMENKAIITDLISNVPLGSPLMISHRCLDLFEMFNLPSYQIFPLRFIYKGNLNQDFVSFSMIKEPSYINYISWDESKFYKTTNFHRIRISEHSFNSIEEFLENKKIFEDAGYGLYPEVKISYHNDFDIINFGRYPLPSGYLCSTRVRDEIIEAGLTGFNFEPLSNDLFINEA